MGPTGGQRSGTEWRGQRRHTRPRPSGSSRGWIAEPSLRLGAGAPRLSPGAPAHPLAVEALAAERYEESASNAYGSIGSLGERPLAAGDGRSWRTRWPRSRNVKPGSNCATSRRATGRRRLARSGTRSDCRSATATVPRSRPWRSASRARASPPARSGRWPARPSSQTRQTPGRPFISSTASR